MPIANVTLNNTFDEWRTVTNQIISFVNDVDTGVLAKFYSNTAVLTVTENIGRTTKNFISLNVSSSTLDTSVLNVATSNAVNTVARNLSNTVITLNQAYNTLNISFNRANLVADATNLIFEQANTGRTHANLSFAQANIVVPALAQANAARDHANISFVQANTARDHANVAFAQANNVGLPVGTVVPYAGDTAPSGWLFCFGQTVSKLTYPALHLAIGYTYGGTDPGNNFNLPDLRGRVVAGKDNMGGTSTNRLTLQPGGVDGDVLGNTGGSEIHTLTIAQIPAHTHTVTGLGSSTNFDNGDISGIRSSGSTTTSSTGGGEAHNNIQPTIILNYIIKV